MATLLAHIQVKTGKEAEFETIAAKLYAETHRNESGCLRYEYWRGAEACFYYALLSFDDFHAFLRHQLSEHHESASPRIQEICVSVKLEWIDPIGAASPLPPTRTQDPDENADSKTARYHELFAAVVQEWWPA
jgi:quinol monooxygenase YgiN